MIKKIFFLSSILISTNLLADNLTNLEIDGSEPVWLKNENGEIIKQIALMKLKFNNSDEQTINQRISNLKNIHLKFNETISSKKELGMNNVPVLDQGMEPTCITFAVTALLNAIKNKGDFISQQCFLQLSETIASYQCPSAWNGTWGSCLLNQAKQYGVVNNKDCPNEYPNKYAGPISVNQHYDLSNNGQWSYSFNYTKLKKANDINIIRNNIANNKRVLVSFLINKYSNTGDPIFEYKNGLWRLPSGTYDSKQVCGYSMEKCAGHAVVITGYDDDNKIFRVRNSWGDKLGANGDYFMSYDYLSVMAINAYTIT